MSAVGKGRLSVQTKDIEFQFFIKQNEMDYPTWWTRKRFVTWLFSLPEDTLWNCYICCVALMAIVWVAVNIEETYLELFDIIYNITYAVHVFGIGYNLLANMEHPEVKFSSLFGFLIDLMTYSHYVSDQSDFKLVCYYLRLHRPFRYLWALNDYNLKGSVLGTTLKYCYIFLVLRVTWALVWLNVDVYVRNYTKTSDYHRALYSVQYEKTRVEGFSVSSAGEFLSALYIVNKMFIPIGPSVAPANDIERVTCLLVMVSGCVAVTGAAVAALSLVISLYMRPEEAFRARYTLIIKEMKESHIPPSQREKVETFYKMYWHKQRAVSCTRLLPTFPPTLPATIYADIYFEATQKTRILCDLSYQFLSELAKKMKTIHYIPGDTIIKRSSTKSSIIYITYGDVEMVTAEDDSTGIVRLTRGTVVAGCGRSHLGVRAATFCTAHVLDTADLWRLAVKHGRTNDQPALILAAFSEHLEKVKQHYGQKVSEEVKHKSSILHFKRCLMALKEVSDAKGNLMLARTDVFLEIAGCYIMRNRADVSQTDEADAICLRSTFPCILQPNSSLQVAWNSFVAILTLVVCFTHPYYLVFKKHVPIEFRFFDYVVTAVYVLDLVVHLSTGANVEEGVPITLPQTSSQQMRSYWFVLDVVGTVPIFEFVGTGHFAGINKLLRLPKVFRVLKSVEEACVYRSNILRFLSYTLLLLIACYLIAALQQSFMCFRFGYCQVTNFTHSPYWEYKPLIGEDVENRLIFGLYWAISMITFTTHMETWGPENWNNVLYTMFVLEICIVLRIFMEAVYSATIMVTTGLREDYDSCISSVKNFLIRNQVDPVLRQRFITYLQLCWYTDKAYSMTNKKSSIFHDLPQHVYQDIVAKQRSKYILSIPFMKLLHKEDLKNISSQARLFYTSPNEILLNTGDITNEMFVIKQGICEIFSPDTKRVIGSIGVKNHFGVLACLLRLPAYYTVRAVTHVQVFSISRKYLLQALELPKLKDAIEFAKEQPVNLQSHQEYHRLLKHREPFLSYQPPNPTPNMERFRLPRKHEQDYVFLHPFNRLGFLSVLRYIFPRFTLRPDGSYLTRYEWFRACCALASAMVFPSFAYLVLQWPALHFVALLLDISAYFDILQRMLVGYFNERGILVYHPASTAAHYLKGPFIVDLFACIALENLESSRKEPFGSRYRVTQAKQFLMLNRLLQLYRLPGAMLAITRHIERRDIIIVIKAIPLFVSLLNVLTCFMVFHSVDIYDSTNGSNWLIVPHNDVGGSWIKLFNTSVRFNLTETPWNLHLATYFWVVYETTTTGYSSFNPSNLDLMQFLFIGMVISAMMTTYFSVRIISIRANVNRALADFQEHMKDIVVFMKRENLDKELQKQVLDYYEYNWDKMGGIDYRSVLKLCDQITLRTDAILHIYGPTFAKCPILSQCDVSLLRMVGRAVRSVHFLRGTRVVAASDVIADMYFLDYGGVDVRETAAADVDADVSTIVKLPCGSVFGNIEGTPTTRCPVTFVATTKVHLLMINSQAYRHIIRDFPVAMQLMNEFYSENTRNYIVGNMSDSLKIWNDCSLSSPMIIRGRKEIVKHLYFKDEFVQLYLIVVSLLCVYADIYNAGFQNNSTVLILTLYALDMGFYLKILMQYMLPLLVNGEHIRNVLLPLRKEYFHGEFKYDVLSCIPIELLSLLSTEHRWMVFSWLRINRMFRIVTVYKCLMKHNERITINLILTTVFSVLIWFTLFVHTTACLWHFIAVMEDRADPGSSWIHTDDGGTWCHNRYVCSLYFVLTTFTQNGVGDIMPKNHSEVMFVSILQIASTMVFMVYVGEFSNIIQFQSYRSFDFYCKYLELQEFLKNNRVSKNLVSMVNKYSLHLWRESRGMQEPHFLKTAPYCLKTSVMSAAYMHHLTRHHVFEKCEPAFLRQLVCCFQLFTYNESMYVVKESEITDSMYFIHTGRIQESTEDGDSAPRVYPAGSYFGILQGLVHDTPYTHSYSTLIKSQVLTLRLDNWAYLLKHFSASRETIHKHMRGADSDSSSGSSQDGYGPSPKPPKAVKTVDRASSATPPLIKDKSSQFVLPPGPSSNVDMSNGAISPDLWPLHNRIDDRINMFDNSSKDIRITQDKVKETLTPTHSLGSVSQASMETLGPKYVANESNSSTAFYDKVTTTAKKFIGTHADADLNSRESSEKDDLLLQEDEAATTALIEEIGEVEERSKENIPEEVLAKTSEESTTKEEETEEHMVTIDITQPKPRVDDLQQTDIVKQKIEVKQGEQTGEEFLAPESYVKENTGPVEDKQEQATSTANRRFIRVRYEDDDREEPTVQTTQLVNNDLKDAKVITTSERNLRTLDSDIDVNVTPEPEDEEKEGTGTGSSSSQHSSSSSSLKRKYERPSEG